MYKIPICNEELTLYGDCDCTEPPTISGITPLTVEVNEEFDPLDGVTAVDCQGDSVSVVVHEV